MNQQDQSRKEFEMWARERGYQRDELARCNTGVVGPEYFNLNTENAWQAWQAARSAAQLDTARLEYMINNRALMNNDESIADGFWLEFEKSDGQRWVQLGEFESPRDAIDAAIASKS